MQNQELSIPSAELEFFERFHEDLFYPAVTFRSPWGRDLPLIYADSTAMGLPMRNLEDRIFALLQAGDFGRVEEAYEEATQSLSRHLNAGDNFEIFPVGTGCTAAMNLLTRDILGYRLPDYWDTEKVLESIPYDELPILITTLMEHHSSDLVLRECLYKELYHIGFDAMGLPDLQALENYLQRIRESGPNPVLITYTAASNVTGIQPDLCSVVSLARSYDARIALDFAAAGPYTELDLIDCNADAYGFSPHKFPGGPQTSGLLCIRKDAFQFDFLKRHSVRISTMIELIRIAEVFRLKKRMSVPRIRSVVRHFAHRAMGRLSSIENIELIGRSDIDRFAIVSFVVKSRFSEKDPPPQSLLPYLLKHPMRDGGLVYFVHHNLVAKLLNDVYGIQVRPGCSCAGPYGHWLLNISEDESLFHRERIDKGLLDQKPGWIRVTLNELNTSEEVDRILDAIAAIAEDWHALALPYTQDITTGEFTHQDQHGYTVGIADWSTFSDDDPEKPVSKPIEEFIRSQILPFAANTHTEINHTGTTCTLWYHWAQETIRSALGASHRHALRFIRAGYDPLRVLLYHLGAEVPTRLHERYGIGHLKGASPPLRIVTLGNPLKGLTLPASARSYSCETISDLLSAAKSEPESTVILAGFDPEHRLGDPQAICTETRNLPIPVILDITMALKNGHRISMEHLNLSGCLVRTERLPGGWQTHPVLLLDASLFRNKIALDVGGGIVDWTTAHLQRYVTERTTLEDAGTPGIIQGIRSGLVLGRMFQ